ncbi:MAG: hypothetical protein IKX88_00055 [Thermoguttaceae bacterium]|nr:hypothetical protein [Thermoguttaceae bacterium]MBR5756974.1 hypothetical protein [Thermoguttaceae bacterium]
MDRRVFLVSTGAVALTLVCGCKPRAPYALVPISGTATYQGKPLDDRFHIQFEPTDGSRPSMAKINTDGTFEAVHTASQKGVKPGENQIVVYWNDPPEVNPVPDEFKELFAKYGFTGSDKLKVEISKKDAKFEVKYE